MCLSTLKLSINKKYGHIGSSALSFPFTKRAPMWRRAVTQRPAKFSKSSPNVDKTEVRLLKIKHGALFIYPSCVICWDVQGSMWGRHFGGDGNWWRLISGSSVTDWLTGTTCCSCSRHSVGAAVRYWGWFDCGSHRKECKRLFPALDHSLSVCVSVSLCLCASTHTPGLHCHTLLVSTAVTWKRAKTSTKMPAGRRPTPVVPTSQHSITPPTPPLLLLAVLLCLSLRQPTSAFWSTQHARATLQVDQSEGSDNEPKWSQKYSPRDNGTSTGRKNGMYQKKECYFFIAEIA